jgi:O-succinylbenzoic acid--CoA ligase
MQQQWVFLEPDPELRRQVAHFSETWALNGLFEIKSSGTTGLPQLHHFTKAQLIHSAQASNNAFELNTQTTALLCLPLTSVGGLMLLARSIVGSFKLLLQLPSSRPLEHLEQHIDFLAMVPTQLQQSLIHDLPKLQKCTRILIGGGALSKTIIDACQAAKLEVWQSYGMTETLSHVALRSVSPVLEEVFTALPGIAFSSSSDCLVIHYPALQTAPIQTKDIIALHSSTSFEWLGRADNAINSGGKKIIPELLEQVLAQHIETAFFITSLPDEKWGEIVAIVLEGAANSIAPDFKAFGLSTAELPKKYVFVPFFDLTNTQKIKRQVILQSIEYADWRSI